MHAWSEPIRRAPMHYVRTYVLSMHAALLADRSTSGLVSIWLLVVYSVVGIPSVLGDVRPSIRHLSRRRRDL